MGYPVYDCDSRAKALMDSSPEIKRMISETICREAISASGDIDRARLAREVFADPALLRKLNDIVHAQVRRDLSRWFQNSPSQVCFVETAILRESNLDRMVSAIWEVTAPEATRIKRVVCRNGVAPDEVKSRIACQRPYVSEPGSMVRVDTIVNDGATPALPRVMALLDGLA